MSFEREVFIRTSEVEKKNCKDRRGYEKLSCLIEDVTKGKTLEANVTGNITGNVTGNLTGQYSGGATFGTAGTGVTENVVRLGSNRYIVTLTLTDVNTGTIAPVGGNEDQGALIYTLPAGKMKLNVNSIASVGLTNTDGNVDADTGQIGIGNSLASGTDGFFNVPNEYVYLNTGGGAPANFTNVTGTATDLEPNISNNGIMILAANVRDVYLNVAANWSAGESVGVVANGTVVLDITTL